jgi:hypothetical protein
MLLDSRNLTTQRKLNANSITTQTQTADVFAYSARETTVLTVVSMLL